MKNDYMRVFAEESRKKYNECYANVLVMIKKAVTRYPTRFSVEIYRDGNTFALTDKKKGMYRFSYQDAPTSTASTSYLANIDHALRSLSTDLASLYFHLETACSENDKWNARFLNLAKTVAGYSKDPSTKVGAVIVDDDDNVRTIGYNGFPRGVKDTEERLNDRSIKYPLTVHAELNAICTCARVGVPTKGATMVCTHFPCADCAGAIVQAGFKEVVVLAPSEDFDSRWNETNNFARTIFTEGNVDVIVFTEDEIKE